MSRTWLKSTSIQPSKSYKRIQRPIYAITPHNKAVRAALPSTNARLNYPLFKSLQNISCAPPPPQEAVNRKSYPIKRLQRSKTLRGVSAAA